MGRITVNLLVFLALPVGILVFAIMHMPVAYNGKEASVWFNEAKLGQPSPGMVAFREMGKRGVPVLQMALQSLDTGDKLKAVWMLGQLGPVASNAIPNLVNCLDDDPSGNLAIHALQSLGTIDPAQVDAIPILMLKLSDPNPGVSNCSADLLNKIEQARKARHLSVGVDDYEYALAFLHGSVQRVRIMGLRKLMQLSLNDKRVEATFQSLLNDTNDQIRAEALRRLKTSEAVR